MGQQPAGPPRRPHGRPAPSADQLSLRPAGQGPHGQPVRRDGDVGIRRAGTSSDLRMRNLAAVARAVHLGGGRRTRADLTRSLGLARGTAAVLAAELAGRELILEQPGPAGARGRPTGVVGPHPRGPVAMAVDLRDESWAIGAAQLGGELSVLDERRHQVRPASRVLKALAGAAATHIQVAGVEGRVIGLAVAMPATTGGGRILQAVHLGWPHLDVAGALGAALDDVGQAALLGGGDAAVRNDATLAGLAEARRGLLREVGSGLHLHVSLGIGGVLIARGRPVTGVLGAAGEFGHMPLSGGDLPCGCGSRGCWDTEVGANALLRHDGTRIPQGERVAAAGRVIRRAEDGDPQAVQAASACAAALGRGAAALVNALDPQIVTLSGLGAALANTVPGALRDAYLAGLMRFRRADPPPLRASTLTLPGPLAGAAELVWDEFLTPQGLGRWPPGPR